MCVLDVSNSTLAFTVGKCRGHAWTIPDGFLKAIREINLQMVYECL